MLLLSPSFWLANACRQRLSPEYTRAADLVALATTRGLLGQPGTTVNGYATCGPVPLALFVDHYARGLFPPGTSLTHFKLPLEIRYRRPLVATVAELAALAAGTLTQLRRPAEYINAVYRSGPHKGWPRSLSVPNADPAIGWTPQELSLATPCYYGQPGDTLAFAEAPGPAVRVTAVTFALAPAGGHWDWVLDLQAAPPVA